MIHVCLLEMKLVNCWPLPWSKRILHTYQISNALMEGIQQVTERTVVHTASHHVEEEENDGGSHEEEELVWHTKGVATAAGYALLASTCFVKIPLHCSQSPDFNTVMNALGSYRGPKRQEDNLEQEQLPTSEEDEQRVKALAQGLLDMEVSNDQSNGRYSTSDRHISRMEYEEVWAAKSDSQTLLILNTNLVWMHNRHSTN